MAALTAKSIEKLKPGPGAPGDCGRLVPGLYYVIQPSGATSWAGSHRFDGRRQRLAGGKAGR